MDKNKLELLQFYLIFLTSFLFTSLLFWLNLQNHIKKYEAERDQLEDADIADYRTTTDQTVSPSPVLKPAVSPKPTLSSERQVEPTKTSNSIQFKFKSQYTQEPVENFYVAIYKKGETAPLIKFQGQGDTYRTDKLEPGEYRMEIGAGNKDKDLVCASSKADEAQYNFRLEKGQSINREISLYPYPGFLYLKTEDYFPVANAEIELTDETGTKIWLKSSSDQLGRVAIYTVNPGAHWVRIKTNDQVFTQKLESETCVWLQKIVLPVNQPRSNLKINFQATVDYVALNFDLLIPDTAMNIKTGSANVPYDSVRKYSLDESRCPGMGNSFRFGPVSSASFYENKNSVTISNVPPGKYKICAYESGKQGVYYASDTPEVVIDGQNDREINLLYPKP